MKSILIGLLMCVAFSSINAFTNFIPVNRGDLLAMRTKFESDYDMKISNLKKEIQSKGNISNTNLDEKLKEQSTYFHKELDHMNLTTANLSEQIEILNQKLKDKSTEFNTEVVKLASNLSHDIQRLKEFQQKFTDFLQNHVLG